MPPPHGRTLWSFLHPSHFKQMTFPSYSSEKVEITQWKPSSNSLLWYLKVSIPYLPLFLLSYFTCRYLCTTQRVLDSAR